MSNKICHEIERFVTNGSRQICLAVFIPYSVITIKSQTASRYSTAVNLVSLVQFESNSLRALVKLVSLHCSWKEWIFEVQFINFPTLMQTPQLQDFLYNSSENIKIEFDIQNYGILQFRLELSNFTFDFPKSNFSTFIFPTRIIFPTPITTHQIQ